MRKKVEGFTLIELMIVVAIAGVLAAIAIPAYVDYVKRSKMSEMLYAVDAITQGASEYHAVMGFFPDESYTAENLANFSSDYATITLITQGLDRNFNIRIRATFNNRLDLTPDDPSNFGLLEMLVTYDPATGYVKAWDLTAPNTIDAIYWPRGGH